MVAAKTENQVGAVYGALAHILSELSVERGGTLPSNMGGKSYITAVDLNAEIKRKFVERGLIILPKEIFLKHEVQTSSTNRHSIFLVIEGHYTIVSTEDGSSVTIGGVGDGLATGTAVAANIASTNALKNALLRTFLVTEQSAEDQAKQEVETDKGAPRASAEPVPSSAVALTTIQGRVRELSSEVGGAGKGKELLQTISAEKWPGKNFVEVWKSVGALEELELELNKLREAK